MRHGCPTLFFVVFFLTGFAGTSYATLITSLQDPRLPAHVVYDDNADQYWIQDLGMFAVHTYNGQAQIIDDINNNADYQSTLWGVWRLASLSDMEGLWLNPYTGLISSFQPSDADLGERTGRYENAGQLEDEGEIVSGHYYVGLTEAAVSKGTLPGDLIPDYVSEDWLGAWVTADSSPQNPVPEPTTVLLLGSGLFGLAGFRKKRKT